MPFASNPRALATLFFGCPVGSSPLACRLDSYLHALYVLAIILAIVLVVVIAVAISLYRRKRSDRSNVV